MNRRNFLLTLAGGIAALAAVKLPAAEAPPSFIYEPQLDPFPLRFELVNGEYIPVSPIIRQGQHYRINPAWAEARFELWTFNPDGLITKAREIERLKLVKA